MKRSYNLGYYISEGFRSIFTHGLMSFAAVCMIVACLIIMGSFSLVAINLERQLGELEKDNEFLAFIDETWSREQALALRAKIEAIPNVSYVVFTTKEEAKESYAEQYAEDKNANLYTELPDELFRDRYSVHVKDLTLLQETIDAVDNVEGVVKHRAAPEIAEGMVMVRNVATGVAVILIAMLLVISIFIIYNTIKLGTFTRSKEIAIMKMCGATNGFVRAPFIIEGMLLGLFGAFVAFWLQWGLYILVVDVIDTGATIQLMTIIPFTEIWPKVLGAFAAIGFVVGTGGSIIAIRKFLQV